LNTKQNEQSIGRNIKISIRFGDAELSRTKGEIMSDSLNPTPDAEQLMFGAIPGKPALGRGPAVDGDYSRHPYHHPAAGWGAAESVAGVLARAGEPIEGFRAIFVMNHADGGFDCPGCAWADDPSGLKLDICENGIKHVTWELQPAKADRDFLPLIPLASWRPGATTTSKE
jgi:hypothetical protein